MSRHRREVRFVKMDAFAWPLAALAAFVFFVLLFKRQIGGAVQRIKSIGKGGVETFPKEILRWQTTAPAPASDALAPTRAPSEGSLVQKLKTEDLLRLFDTPLILERDRAIREDLDRLENQADRERVLIRHLAGSYIVREFERVYALIFGSQVEALAYLNSAGDAGAPVEEVRRFYENAAAAYPITYENFKFEQWTGFLKQSLLVRDSENGIAITEWGHEFLVHLARSRLPVFKFF